MRRDRARARRRSVPTEPPRKYATSRTPGALLTIAQSRKPGVSPSANMLPILRVAVDQRRRALGEQRGNALPRAEGFLGELARDAVGSFAQLLHRE